LGLRRILVLCKQIKMDEDEVLVKDGAPETTHNKTMRGVH